MSTAAMQRARQDAGGTAELDRLLTRGQEFSGEVPQFLANHLPMVIVALHRLGANDARLTEYFETYRDAKHLVPMPPAVAPIERASWSKALGDRSRERDYREFFAREVAQRGIDSTIAAYLPTLTPAVASSALHGWMRLAYGVLRDDAAEVGAGRGSWSPTKPSVGTATGAAPVTDGAAG